MCVVSAMFNNLLGRWRHRPAQRPPLPLAAPIDQVRIVALDCETTGLDPRRDRIVSVATVPIEGAQCCLERCTDRLVNPGRPIPERSSAVHGIRDGDVADAPDFATMFPELDAALDRAALLGHEVGFDAAMIRRETHLARLPWVTPALLDTLLLYSAVAPAATDLRLEAIAERLGVTIRGRHTALGDARATAEIFLRLLPDLARRGATTLGDLLALCHEQHRLLRLRMGPRW
jgi:DNA polymerase III epsilon subunit-like protein